MNFQNRAINFISKILNSFKVIFWTRFLLLYDLTGAFVHVLFSFYQGENDKKTYSNNYCLNNLKYLFKYFIATKKNIFAFNILCIVFQRLYSKLVILRFRAYVLSHRVCRVHTKRTVFTSFYKKGKTALVTHKISPHL